MIEKVRLKYFKRFREEEFILGDHVVLAGPNNSGKSTLLQAIAVWNLAVLRWLMERGAASSRAELRTGVAISRKGFTAIPLREMNLLWNDRSTAFSKDEIPGVNPGSPKPAAISIQGVGKQKEPWEVGVDLRYSSKEQIYVKLTDGRGHPITDIPDALNDIKIVYIPPFSGIGAEETRYDPGYQNLLIGQGKPGDILRNLLLEIYLQKNDNWRDLKTHIHDIFGYELIDPRYTDTDPFIVIEYQEGGRRKPFDLASAGSGFHQVLTLLGFLYAREASVLLIDEPDAHEHVILQRQVYDRLRGAARERNCQLVISTHSEVILEETAPGGIMSFYGKPHRLAVNPERDQIREALRRVSSQDLLCTEDGQNILYVEDVSDLKIMTAFAKAAGHPLYETFLEKPFFYPIHGRNPAEARAHFFGLKAIRPDIRGVLLLDGDNRGLPDHEIAADQLGIIRWRRYEIENYLIHPEGLSRFVRGTAPLFRFIQAEKAEEYLALQLPPDALQHPAGDNDFLFAVPASKRLLPGYFKAAGVSISKKEYYQVAAQMKSDEIHPEVIEKLNVIAELLLN